MLSMVHAGMGSVTDQEIGIYSRRYDLPHEWVECDKWWVVEEFCRRRPTELPVHNVWIIVLCSRKYGGLRQAMDAGVFSIAKLLAMLSALEKSHVHYHVFLQ